MTEQSFSLCYRNWINIYQLTPERASLQLHTILNHYYSERNNFGERNDVKEKPPDVPDGVKPADPAEGGEPR